MKKLISLFTTLSIVFTMLGTFTVFAEETAADLEIGTLAELEAFRDDVNSGNTYEGKNVKLTADIDMSEKYGADINGEEISWSPIGTEEQPFNGIFYGRGHIISGLYINSRNTNSGLFGHTDNKSIIKNLTVDGCMNVNTDTNKSQYAGAIAGHNQGIIESCNNGASVNAIEALNGGIISGGIAGFNNGIIRKCTNSGMISTKTYLVGGVCGRNFGIIENCFNAGAVSGKYLIGGLCAQLMYSGRISNCFNIGSVDGEDCVGDMVGDDRIQVIDNVYYCMTYKPDETTSDIGTAKTAEQFASGEVAYLLGDEWGQNIGVDEYPVIGGDKVYLVNNTYTNTAPNIETNITEISTLAELEAFRDDVNNGNTYEGKTVKLTADIDMSEKYGKDKMSWTPIAISDWENDIHRPFSGTFDGDNHTINGLYINSEERNVALFSHIEGTLKNLNVKGAVSTTNADGEAAGIAVAVMENASIIDCTFDGTVKSPHYAAGGIAAENFNVISGCIFKGKVEGMHLSGGISCNMDDGAIITNCVNEGEIIGTVPVGGITGAVMYNSTITNCINKGSVMGRTYIKEGYNPVTSMGIGGIAGALETTCSIENCYNTGVISGNTYTGGILGSLSGATSETATVRNCYNLGNITSTLETDSEHYINGIIGSLWELFSETPTTIPVEAINCYYLLGTADKGMDGTDTTTALTAEQFADEASFTNWDFDTVWKMDTTLKRPVLRSNTEDTDEVIEISTLEELEAFRDDVNSGNTYEGKTVKLTADIDMSEKYGEGKLSWEPISDNNLIPFIGTFDGCFCKITGLYSTNNGLFMFNNGTIQNVSVSGEIICRSDGGGIVGNNFGKIICCSFSGSITGGFHLGGIAGANMALDEGTGIFDCYNTATVTSNEGLVGGIAGLTTRIERSYNTGRISANDMFAGVGVGDGPIIDCYYLSGTADGADEDTTTELTAEQFADKESFTNWDFETVWKMDTTLGRPVLRSNTEEPPIETHTHTLVHHAAVAAACTETGTGEYWKCEGTDACNKMFSDANGTTEIAEIPTIAATGHKEVTDVAVEPTCETDGKTAGSHCSVCNTVITEQTIIPKLNHNWGAWNITTEPTFDVTGKAERICENDNTHKEVVDLPILTDTKVWTEDLKIEPTETENGLVVYTSQYGNVQVIIPALNPDYDYSIKYENGKAIVTVPQDGTYTVIFAAYDNGRLLSVNAQDIQLVKGENSPISPQNFNANGKVKVMLWDSLKGMKPLCAADGN